MSALDLQGEEREVLLSIYEGDTKFKAISPTTYQYKYGEDNDGKSFLLEISWPPEYPMEKPSVSLETFYNKHLTEDVKNHIKLEIERECEPLIGEAMTYTLFEWAKEKETELVELQPDSVPVPEISQRLGDLNIETDPVQKAERKVQLSKAQKRRQWDRADYKGEKPRGWDWVDIVKHLSQTGSKQDQDSATA